MKNPSRWWEDALCRGLDSNIWFPDTPQGRDYFAVARKHCNNCPVSQECLASALAQDPDNDRYGMFGGKSPRERLNIRFKIETKSQFVKSPQFHDVPKDRPEPRVGNAVRNPLSYTYAFKAKNPTDHGLESLRRKPNDLTQTDIPKQTQLLLKVTHNMPASQLTAQASAAMIMAGWEDPIDARTAAAMFMGASYVGNLSREGVEAGVLTAQENAAIQGVVELAMQVWKYHVVNGNLAAFGKTEG